MAEICRNSLLVNLANYLDPHRMAPRLDPHCGVASTSMAIPAKTDQACELCAALPFVTVDNAFGQDTNVYRVDSKIFALVNVEDEEYVTVKALPEDGEALRAQYEFVRPGYYMNKRHWVTIDVNGDLPTDELDELITAVRALDMDDVRRQADAQ